MSMATVTLISLLGPTNLIVTLSFYPFSSLFCDQLDSYRCLNLLQSLALKLKSAMIAKL